MKIKKIVFGIFAVVLLVSSVVSAQSFNLASRLDKPLKSLWLDDKQALFLGTDFDLVLSKDGIVYEGATANAHETTLTVVDPTADRTVTFPNATGFVALGGNVSLVSGANTACNTTCGGASKCVAGQNTADMALVACATATADVCICVAQ